MIRHDVSLAIGDRALVAWEHYHLDYDLRSRWPEATMAAHVTDAAVAREVYDAACANPECRLYVDGQRLSTLRVQRVEVARGGEGTVVRLAMRGKASVLGCVPMPLGWRPTSQTLAEVVRELASPLGVGVVTDRTAAALELYRRRSRTVEVTTEVSTVTGTEIVPTGETRTVEYRDDRETRPRPGESVAVWLARVVARHGVRMFELPGGELFVGQPASATSQTAGLFDAAATRMAEGAVLSWSVGRALGGTPHAVRVVGRVSAGGRALVDETARDDLADAWPDAVVIENQHLRGGEEGSADARRILADYTLGGRTVVVEVVGNGTAQAVAWPDRMYTVNIPAAGVDVERMYCIAASWSHSSGGTRARVTLVDRDAWAASSVG